MDWITDTIGIGNYVDARNSDLRRAEGIRSIICLDAELADPNESDLDLDAIELYGLMDGPGNDPEIFRRAVKMVGELARDCPKLLVHCRAGRSRSVVVVAGHLMQANGWVSQQAIDYIAGRREIALTPGIEGLLRAPWLRGG